MQRSQEIGESSGPDLSGKRAASAPGVGGNSSGASFPVPGLLPISPPVSSLLPAIPAIAQLPHTNDAAAAKHLTAFLMQPGGVAAAAAAIAAHRQQQHQQQQPSAVGSYGNSNNNNNNNIFAAALAAPHQVMAHSAAANLHTTPTGSSAPTLTSHQLSQLLAVQQGRHPQHQPILPSSSSSVTPAPAASAPVKPAPSHAPSVADMQSWSLQQLRTFAVLLVSVFLLEDNNNSFFAIENAIRLTSPRFFPPISLNNDQYCTGNRADLLQHLNQPIPHALSLLLSDATRREERRKAKRLANRKSASTSRARKKQMVQQMTELNNRLRRQALILALLPDLVIVINADGVISFCSDQVERVLYYKSEELVGAKLTDVMVPSSRGKLLNLVQTLVGPEEEVEEREYGAIACEAVDAKISAKRPGEEADQQERVVTDGVSKSSGKSSDEAAKSSGGADPFFPMSVVRVAAAEAENDNSDTSASRESKMPSSLTNSASLGNSNASGSEDTQRASSDEKEKATKEKEKNAKTGAKGLPSSDTSNTSSSLDADVKKLSKANANLERNVRYHNMKKKRGTAYKDDVTGAAVTANNASARLSSLRVPSRSRSDLPSSEEDSGYRESNDSREETSSSSASDLSETNGTASLDIYYF